MNNMLLERKARTATAQTPDQVTGSRARGVQLILDVTKAPENEDKLTVSIQARAPVTGKYVTLTAFAATSKGEELGEGATLAFTLYPGASETAAIGSHEVQALPLPTRWRAVVTHSGEGSWTYSLGALALN